jgi:hypothetical protein
MDALSMSFQRPSDGDSTVMKHTVLVATLSLAAAAAFAQTAA